MRRNLTLRGALTLGLVLALGGLSATAHAQYAGNALRFDGNDDFVAVRNTGDFKFEPSFTIEAWVKPASLPQTSDYRAIVFGSLSQPPVSGGAWGLFLDDQDASSWGLTVSTPSTHSAKVGPGGLVAGAWQHLAVTYNGTTMRAYRDGVLVAAEAHTNPGDPSNPAYVLLGRWIKSFRGTIDEIRIWSEARSQSAIQTYMNCSLEGDEEDLVAYYRFDEGEGQIAEDSAGVNNVGRLGSTVSADPQDPVWVTSDAPIDCRTSENDRFRRGDINGDAKRDISDAVGILGFLFLGSTAPTCMDAADSNDDGDIDMSDPVVILSLLFLGQVEALPSPFPGCGGDPTRDHLDCDSYAGVCRLVIPIPLPLPVE